MKNLEEPKAKCSDIMNRLSELSDDELKEVFGGIGEVIKPNANLDDFSVRLRVLSMNLAKIR